MNMDEEIMGRNGNDSTSFNPRETNCYKCFDEKNFFHIFGRWFQAKHFFASTYTGKVKAMGSL